MSWDWRACSAATSTAATHTPTVAESTTSAMALRAGMGPPPPPPLSDDHPAWADEVWASPLDVRRRIFCNRSLNMSQIRAVGFDMDYTCAQYKPETFEMLAYTLTIEKLVTVFGYPSVLYDFDFDWRYMVRGLTIDKRRGNVLKLDRHKYVKLAYHGFQKLSREQRLATYANALERSEFDEPDYALIDTLFSLAEAHLFMQLVELQDSQPHALPAGKATPDLYKDVRAAVDLCHRDGSLKRAVAADPGRYIHEDLRLAPTLDTLRASGRQVFLATNSLWDYTHIVMNFLLHGRTGAERNYDWLEYFNVVITGCGKPDFFIQKKPLFEVHLDTGLLYNTDGGTPMVPIGEEDLPTPAFTSSAPRVNGEGADRRARVFQGGFYRDLHRMLGVASGTECLYVGDHIYGDILRSKKTLGWRTMLVVPELESELEVQAAHSGVMRELKALRQQRDGLEDHIQRLEWGLAHGTPVCMDGLSLSAEGDSIDGSEDDLGSYMDVVANLREQQDAVRERHRALLAEHHERFHPVWGQLLKTGYQNSRFAHQVERFACLYTSHVSNLHFYSPDKCYRGRMDHMAHEEESVFEEAASCLLPRKRPPS
ncbi:hypothetical protein WJX81_001142 [Elliptochloris bilobata]|uniref:Uncharacterized protein n=1 Tax=Elliptochloris bilobata TaxID=381761 RepID=A0AAW1SDD5_9CHLO